jgi:hypothetical protein
MHRLMTAFAVAGIGLLASGCGGGSSNDAKTETTTPTSTAKLAPPIADGALKGLLLPPEQVNVVMGVDEMTITKNHVGMSDDSATMEPRECLAVDGAAQAAVYAGSGYTAVRDQTLQQGDNFTHFVEQVVVSFSSAKQASAFFDSSAKQWPACHEYKHLQSGTEWEADRVSNVDGILSTTGTQANAGSAGWACGRALAARNNVVIDVNTCSADPGTSAVDIAKQIAAKIPTVRE